MSHKPIKVLLMEDNPPYARLIRGLLAKAGDATFELECADRLSAGLERLAAGDIDLVLLDLGLPDSQGLDTLFRVQAQAPQAAIVVLTGIDDERLAIKALQAGTQDYLVKGQVDGNLLVRSMRYATERKQAQEALRTSKANFSNIIEKSADAIVIVDRSGMVRFVNPAAKVLFGRKSEELLGELFGFPIVAGETTELEIMRPRRKTAIAEMRTVETEWEGETAYLASLRDITQRKQAEEALRKLDRMKSEFISNISHELRSPLHAIKGFTRLMLEGKVPDPETQKEFLTIVDEQSGHLSSLVDNVLDMSCIESGRFGIQKLPTSINNIIHGAVESFYAVANEKGIVITKDIPATLPQIEIDRDRLKQVMVNLLSNAIKFSVDGGPVTVKVEARGSELLVQITDHGIGIPKETMPYLFERFHQMETGSSIGGTGLGLYISKQIIEAHGGHIWAESKEGEGSTFSFTLPLGQARDESHE